MIGWINNLLLLGIALALIIWRKWPHLHWLFIYALVDGVFGIIYNAVPLFKTYDIYFLKRYLLYLLILAAVSEILRTDFRINPKWIYAAYSLIVFSMLFLQPNGTPYYYIPRIILLAGVAYQVSRAITNRHIPLLAFSIIAIGGIVGDALMLLQPNLTVIFKIQQIIDPFWYTVSYSIILGAALVPAFERLKSLLIGRPEGVILHSTAAELALTGPGNFNNPVNRPGDINCLENALRAAELSTEMSQKNNLSLSELGFYLGADERIASKFVDIHNIKRNRLRDDQNTWTVSKSDVDTVLNRESDNSE